MSWMTSFLHPQRGYQAGQNELDRRYQEAQQYQQPYNQYGQDAYGNINTAMQQLLNPQALQDKWASGYKESESARIAEEMAKQHGLDAASSMGLMGSTPALQAIQAGTSKIGADDRQNYMNDLLQKYLSGTGIGQNIFGIGANTAGQMGQRAMDMGQNSAQMQFNKTNAPGSMFGNLLGAGGALAGGAMGGPIGSALGAGLSQKMGWSPTGQYNTRPQMMNSTGVY